MELVSKIDREYRIQSESAKSFRGTIPRSISRTSGVSKGDKLGIRVGVENSYGVIDFHQNPSSNMVTREVAGSNHLIRVPSSIGSSMQLRRNMFNWELHKKTTGDFVFRMKTPYIPLMISDRSWSSFSDLNMKPTKTDDREHFSFYIDRDLKSNLSWSENTEIGYLIAQRDGQVCIRCHPSGDNKELFTTQINHINKNSAQLRTYIPRSLIRSIDFQDKQLEILTNDNSLCISRL